MAEQNIGWSKRVAYSGIPGSDFAHAPDQVIVHGPAARDRARKLIVAAGGKVGVVDADKDDNFRIHCTGVDVINLIEDLRLESIHAEPNFVFFAHSLSANPLYGNPLYGNPLYGNPLYGNPLYGNPLYGNPLYGNPLYGNPLYGNPLYGNPLYGNPLYGNPLYGNPLYGNPLYGNPISVNEYMQTGLHPNSARPAEEPTNKVFKGARTLDIVVLDSGLAGTFKQKNQLPPLLKDFKKTAGQNADVDSPDDDGDDTLDPVAGHGTFIAGLIELLAPGRKINVRKVFKREGDVNEWDLGTDLDAIAGNDKMLLNLSFGGYTTDDLGLLPQKLRKLQRKGVVVVASAGNDGSSRPLYPAALKEVVSVGALGAYGPAWFSNYGPWVRACAPGVEVVSTFFNNFDGPIELKGKAKDPDQFKGWAYWSGTSFAAPVVVAALSREMVRAGCNAKEAVARVIDAPGLFRLAGLGTVVNTG